MAKHSRYSKAKWLPVGGKQRTRKTKPATLILHSGVMSHSRWHKKIRQSLRGFFTRSVLESHWFIDRDGTVEQYVSANMRADANYRANSWALSVETADDGNPDTTPWTPQQITALARLALWCHQHHGVPLRRTRNVWDSGINGHSSHGAPSLWTNARGKTCPGKVRKKQIPEVIELATRYSKGQHVAGDGDVAKLQDYLNLFNRNDFSPQLVVDGDYGPLTNAAFKAVHNRYTAREAEAKSGIDHWTPIWQDAHNHVKRLTELYNATR